MVIVVEDESQVHEQVTERTQRSSPTGRGAAYHSDSELVTRSQAFIHVLKQVDRVSNSILPVLLIGESGTVKDLVASAIHHCSSRRDHPFIPLNCGAISAETIEAELFGQATGSRTETDQWGLWEQADGGTIFLDEITKANSSLQEKLLLALQTGEIPRVDSDQTRRVDVRVIAAANQNIEQEVAAGKFRSDLFYRLNAATIVLPMLRDEPENSVAEKRHNDDWVTLSEIEGRYVARVLEHTRGNKQAAARLLSVDRKTLDRMIKRHHIIPQHTRGQRAKA